MQFFTLAVLPAQFAQVPVLAHNLTLDCGEDSPFQDSLQVFPVPKGQGGQMRIIAHLHPRGTSGSSTSAIGASPTRTSALFFISDAAAATSTAAAAKSVSLSSPSSATPATSSVAVSPTDQLCQRHGQERSYISPTLQIEEDGIQREGF